MPFGNFEPPFNLPQLAASAGAPFVARWTALHVRQLTWTIEEALERRGFRFIEVIAPCPTLYARLNKLGSGLDQMRFYEHNAEIRNGTDPSTVAIDFQKTIVCGKFVDANKPTYHELLDSHYRRILGDRYVPMPPEGGWLHD
jgi:2-oxoglutarate ferredoxin oxidoreductase subunit beta